MKIEIKCTGSDTIVLDDLTEFQGNLKKRTDKDFKKIAASIQKHGFSFPFFVWKDKNINYVMDGHGRLETLKRMQDEGWEVPALPCVYIEASSEADAKEKLLKLNSQYGKMTAESVAEFLDGLTLDFEELQLPEGVLDLASLNPEGDTEGDDECPEVNKEEADSKLGEMYELGNSILMCGDSTNEEDVERLMGGVKADLCVTDPPYNVNLGQGGSIMTMRKRHRRTDGAYIQNDHMEDSEFFQFLYKMYLNIGKFTKKGGAFYVWHADNEGLNFRLGLKEAGLTLRQTIIWKKDHLCMGRQDYQWIHEPCLYGWIDGDQHCWYSDRKQTTVIDCKRPLVSVEHPTMKPVELIEYQIKNSSKSEDIILDLFGGSGTTLIAAEKNNRKARLMELDPHYCDVIRKRWTKWAEENGREVGSGGLH